MAAGSRKSTQAYRAVLDEHRARFDRVSQRTAPAELKKIYDRAQDELAARLHRLVRAGKGDTFTAHQHRILLSQSRQGQILIAQRLASGMGPISDHVQTESLRGLGNDVARLAHHYTGAEIVLPIEEASRFQRTIEISRGTLIRAHRASFARYGAQVTAKIEDELSLSLATGESTMKAIDRVQDAAGSEWWKAERIVRTECAAAYNRTHADGILESHHELPTLKMRWSEHVDDATGAPLDDRVSVDSLAIASQIADPGGVFTMPPTSLIPDAKGRTLVPPSLAGRTFACPPSRPNGREVLSPWMPGWSVPAWRWDGSRRVPV